MKFSDLRVGDVFTCPQQGGTAVWQRVNEDPYHNPNAVVVDDNVQAKGTHGLFSLYVDVFLVEKEKEMKKFGGKIVTQNAITVFVDGQMYSAGKEHLNFVKLREAVEDNDAQAFLDNYNVISSETLKGKGIEILDNNVYFNGKVLHNTLCVRLLALVRAGKDVSSMTKFLENLMKNPSSKAINELYDFLENKNLPLTDDGCFLGYKSVGSDFWSKRGGNLTLLQGKEDNNGRIYNAVGETIECPRNEVDDERDNECSYGLHVGGLEYSGVGGTYHSPGDKCLVVKVNPADVIAVPRDYNAQKLRTCKYEVVSEFAGALNKPVYESGDKYTTDEDYSEDDYDYDAPTYVDVSDLVEGDTISFDYKGERRYAVVIDFIDDVVHTKLLSPESDVGEYRNFTDWKMENVAYYN